MSLTVVFRETALRNLARRDHALNRLTERRELEFGRLAR